MNCHLAEDIPIIRYGSVIQQRVDAFGHMRAEASGPIDFIERHPPNAVEKVVTLTITE